MKYFFFLFAFFLFQLQLVAQVTVGSISPVLVGTTGNFSVAGGMMLSSSTGETVVPTFIAGNLIVTQGFQQPSANGTLALGDSLDYSPSISCQSANDGFATVHPFGGTGPFTYQWSTGPNDTNSAIYNLAPGTYTVTITDAGGLTVNQTFIVADNLGACDITIYSGVTPNGDGHNDSWVIEHLELFQPNLVTIYNRWGEQVWQKANYDNVHVVWRGESKDDKILPDGTYYYVIEYNKKTIRNWVELSH